MSDLFEETEKELAEQSRFACWELAKYLFTANTGAAAGLLLLLRSTPGDIGLLFSFGFFCFGTFCVLISYFFGAYHSVGVSIGFQKDRLNGLDKSQIAARHTQRVYGWQTKPIQLGGWLSFVSLIVGGAIAAFAFFEGAIPANEPPISRAMNIVDTNLPAISLSVTSDPPVSFPATPTNASSKVGIP